MFVELHTVVQSVCKTGRTVIAHEAPVTQGFAAEVASAIQVRESTSSL